MSRFWRIFWHEYRRHVLRWRFLLALLSIPLWFGFVIIMGVAGMLLTMDSTPIGYVDHSGTLARPALPPDQQVPLVDLDFIPYADEPSARAALEAGEIQAYFVLSADYRQTRQARMVYLKEPAPQTKTGFTRLLRYNLLAHLPERTAWRVFSGENIVLEAIEEQRSTTEGEFINLFVPFGVGLFLTVSIFSSSGYLMQAVVDEKQNRTMEILATSASPGQIMAAKITALISVGLTQVLAWLGPPLGLLALAAARIPGFPLAVERQVVVLAVVTALPTFVLVAAVTATIGAAITESSEGQAIMTIVMLPGMLPYFLLPVLTSNPEGVVAVALSYFPLTASMTLLIRVGFSSVPPWQVYTVVALLVLCAAGALWLSGRVFRLGMLRYGKPLGWKEIAGLVWRRRTKNGDAAV